MNKSQLGSLVKIRTGKLDANASSVNGKYPFFTCSRKTLKIDSFSYDTKCVLVAGNGDLNVKYYEGKFDAYQRTYIIESVNEKILDTRYLYWFLFKYVEKLRELSIGGVIKYIKLNNLIDAQIPLPSRVQQEQIEKILDQADSLLEKRKQAIELLNEYLKSVFLDMFGDPVKNPMKWEVKELLNLVSEDCPLTYGIVQPGEEFDEGIFVVRPVDLVSEYISTKGLKKINPTIDRKFKRTKLRGGELLLSVRGTTGIISIAEYDLIGANVTRGITPIWFSETFNSSFAFHQIRSTAIQRNIQKKTYGIALQQINLKDIRELKLINPPISLQNKFADIVKNTEIIKKKMITQEEALEMQFQSLMQKSFFN